MTELRRYSCGKTYRPVPPEERKYGGPKFRGEKGRYVGKQWFPDLPLLADEDRQMPETRPDDQAADHRWGCECQVCARPGAAQIKRRALRRRAKVLASSAGPGKETTSSLPGQTRIVEDSTTTSSG